jgi:hypothetical protein
MLQYSVPSQAFLEHGFPALVMAMQGAMFWGWVSYISLSALHNIAYKMALQTFWVQTDIVSNLLDG